MNRSPDIAKMAENWPFAPRVRIRHVGLVLSAGGAAVASTRGSPMANTLPPTSPALRGEAGMVGPGEGPPLR